MTSSRLMSTALGVILSLLSFGQLAQAGSDTTVDNNRLFVEPSQATPGTAGHVVEIFGTTIDDVSGYTIVVEYDNEALTLVDVNLVDTLSEAVGAEYANLIDNGSDGFLIFGVQLDLLPPFEGQVIPALPQFDLVFANLVFDIADDVTEDIPISFGTSLGSPPSSNMFVVDFESVTPQTIDGTIQILTEIPFLRGDANLDTVLDLGDPVRTIEFLVGQSAGSDCLKVFDSNDDGAVDLGDAVYTLNYLFLDGPILPAPFPTEGLDPTPDELPCFAF